MLFGPSREQQGETQPVRKATVLVPTAGTSPAGPLSALSMGLALARVTVANVLHSICTGRLPPPAVLWSPWNSMRRNPTLLGETPLLMDSTSSEKENPN